MEHITKEFLVIYIILVKLTLKIFMNVIITNWDECYQLGGPSWTVQLGRRDSITANKYEADSDLPAPLWIFLAL